MHYRVSTDPALPQFAPLKPWPKLLAWLGFPVARVTVFAIAPNQRIICNPASVSTIQRELSKVGHSSELERPTLTAVGPGASK